MIFPERDGDPLVFIIARFLCKIVYVFTLCPAADRPFRGSRSLSAPRPLAASPCDDIDRVFEGGVRRHSFIGLEMTGEGQNGGVLSDPLLEPRDHRLEDLGPGGATRSRDLIDLPGE